MLAQISESMTEQLGETAREAMTDSAKRAVRTAKAVGKIRTGLEPRFALEQAAVMRGMIDGMQPSLLTRYRRLNQSSWQAATIKRMENIMSVGLAEGATGDDLATRLMDEGFMKERYRAERIARTESMYATNAAQVIAGREMAREQPTIRKKLLAILDERTHPGCLELHETVIGWDEEFVDSDGHRAKFPPLHPNCRCSCVPWDETWGDS
jgi:SPP1 gp7 family putative phage head morphogenesis protein